MCWRVTPRILVSVSGEQNFSMADVQHTAQDFWASRPRRPRKGRKIAGVAAGIANRYRIDPTLVRVALVVAAIYGGAGLVIYLLGWLCLPEEDDEVSPVEGLFGRGRSSTSSAFTIVLCLAFIPVLSWFFSGFPGFLGLLAVVGLLMLLHRGRAKAPPPRPGTAPPVPPDPFAAAQPYPAPPYPYGPPPDPATPSVPLAQQAAQPTGQFSTPVPETAQAPQTPDTEPSAAEPEPKADFPDIPPAPPAWDPLGAAPFAWDLPDPAPAEPAPEPLDKRRRSKVGLVTAGLALVVGGALVLLSDTAALDGWLTEQHIVGIVLGVLGLGMVAGSFVRGGRGLIGLAVPLAVIGLGLTTVSPSGGPSGGVGDIDQLPTSVSQVRPVYDQAVGSIKLDLSQLPDTNDTVRTHVQVGAGSAKVVVPADADVEATCQADVGDVKCLGQKSKELGADALTVTSEGPGNLKIYLTVEVTGAGDVEVTRD